VKTLECVLVSLWYAQFVLLCVENYNVQSRNVFSVDKSRVVLPIDASINLFFVIPGDFLLSVNFQTSRYVDWGMLQGSKCCPGFCVEA